MRLLMRLLSLCILILSGCGEQGLAPLARIDLTPRLLCEGDPTQSVVASARRSERGDGSAGTLLYDWQLSRAPTTIVRGALDEVEFVARFDARGPISVLLKLEDEEGRVGLREKLLVFTRTKVVDCAAGCAEHEECVSVGNRMICADTQSCAGDDECGCLRCKPDDAGDHRCLP